MTLALVCAVAAAVGYAISTLVQAVATKRAQGLAVIVTPLALLGFAIDGAAWLSSLVALDRLPLFVVQAIQASSLIGVVLGAWWFFHLAPRRIDLVMAGVVTAALAVLAIGAGEQPATAPATVFVTACVVAGVVLLGVFLVAYRRGPSILMAGLAGLGYSLAAVAARGSHHGEGLLATIAQPLVIPLICGGAVGVLGYLRSLEHGSPGAVAAIVGVIEVVVPGAIGLSFLGDTVRSGWWLPVAAAVLVAIAGCVVIALGPAGSFGEETEEALSDEMDAISPSQTVSG
ncbi:MAG: hypothetical protein LBM23_06890 [Propionibacteriaceae bacterium]|jgi:hypothetical protein|nr:hypothetical protein [Propionibacteriaceae bacterium]